MFKTIKYREIKSKKTSGMESYNVFMEHGFGRHELVKIPNFSRPIYRFNNFSLKSQKGILFT